MTKINGYCPMGCGWTLHIDDGYITCSHDGCPRPNALSSILGDSETEHIVKFSETSFTVLHPLRERLDEALMACDLGAYIAHLPESPVNPGRYRALPSGDIWEWEPIEGGAS